MIEALNTLVLPERMLRQLPGRTLQRMRPFPNPSATLGNSEKWMPLPGSLTTSPLDPSSRKTKLLRRTASRSSTAELWKSSSSRSSLPEMESCGDFFT